MWWLLQFEVRLVDDLGPLPDLDLSGTPVETDLLALVCDRLDCHLLVERVRGIVTHLIKF